MMIQAISYCLDAEGITLDDVELVVQNANFSMFERDNGWFQGPRRGGSGIRRIVTISHHLAHAYSAIGTSPFDEAAVLVIDGCGNAFNEAIDRAAAFSLANAHDSALDHLHFEKDSYYHFDGRDLKTIAKDFSPWGYGIREYPMLPATTTQHSIGGFYQAASVYCLGGVDDSGKLMGLAPYGKPGVYASEIFAAHAIFGFSSITTGWRSLIVPFSAHRASGPISSITQTSPAGCRGGGTRRCCTPVDHRHGLHPSEKLGLRRRGGPERMMANRRILREIEVRKICTFSLPPATMASPWAALITGGLRCSRANGVGMMARRPLAGGTSRRRR